MSSLTEFLSKKGDGVFYIGHASALARIGRHNILFDPVWDHKPYGEYWYFNPPQVNCDQVQTDNIFISHIHEDHVSERVLRHRYPIRIMNGRRALKDRLEIASQHPVYEYEPWRWHKHEDYPELQFYFVPHAFNSIDSSVFVRDVVTGYCVYHGNDNFLCEAALKRLRNEIFRVDVAMVPYAFIHWYPGCMVMPEQEKIDEVHRLNKQSLDQAQMFIEYMKPKITIPFGSSLYHVNEEFNKHLAIPEQFIGAVPMWAGDYILEKEVYRAERTLHDDVAVIEKKVAFSDIVENHQLIVNGYVIDLETKEVFEGQPTKDFTMFDFAPIEWRKWINCEITFEQAIGTRQFKCTRVPNKYNLKVFEWMNRWL